MSTHPDPSLSSLPSSSVSSSTESTGSPSPASQRKSSHRFRAARVLVALPAYNEEESLPELLERIGESFADSGLPYEVVIVNDGSRDATAQIIEQYSLQMPIHGVTHVVNQGLGITIRDALREPWNEPKNATSF